MRRLSTWRVLAGGVIVVSVAALSACGASSPTHTARARGTSGASGREVVDIYSSLPMRGPAAAHALALASGIRLALIQAGGRAGPFTVHYAALDDSGSAEGWDADQTAANARKAAADPHAVYYIGELDNDASVVSMPILNQAGIPQVSPANTYVGLTTDDPGSASGEPRRYWPTGTRTYLRIVPLDSAQAAAVLEAMKQARCGKVAVADDREPYGAGLAKLVELEKDDYGIDVVSQSGVARSAAAFRTYAARASAAGADCFLLAAVASKHAVQLTTAVHAALPTARIFAPAEMCTSAWTNPVDGGVPAGIDPLIECIALTRNLTAYPGGKAFLAAYKAQYGVADPSPSAILGYEAMKLGLSTIASLGADGDRKSAVLRALFATTDRHSVLGTYGFDQNGDTTLRSYGLYKVGPNGNPMYVRTITPPHEL